MHQRQTIIRNLECIARMYSKSEEELKDRIDEIAERYIKNNTYTPKEENEYWAVYQVRKRDYKI